MNKFFVMGAFLSMSVFVNAQVKVFKGTFQEVQQKAKKEKQYLVVEFYTSWCGYCKKFDSEVLAVPEVGEYLKSRFLVYKCNAELEKDLALSYGVKGYPTLLIFDQKGDVINRKNGFVNKAAFLALLQSLNVKEKAQTVDYEQYLELAQLDFDQELEAWKTEAPDRAVFLEQLQVAVGAHDILKIEDLKIEYSESERFISFFERELSTEISASGLREALHKEWLYPDEVDLFLRRKLIVNREKVKSEQLQLLNELLLVRKKTSLKALKLYVLVSLGQPDYAKKYKKEALKELKKMKQSTVLIESIKL